MQYGPLSYYNLTAVGPRTRTREPWSYKRKRRNRPPFIIGVGPIPPFVTRTAVVNIGTTASTGTQFRIRIKQTRGDDPVHTVVRASSFTVNQ